MAPAATVVSFRLGGTDGVSVEAQKWSWALGELGFAVRRVAGHITDPGPDDVVLPGLALAPAPDDPPARASDVRAALAGSDLVVVENLCSLPLNVDAARAVAGALEERDGRVVLRHHDLPWQRRALVHLEHEFPPRLDGALHVTVNLRSMRELHARRVAAVAMHNRFDLDAPLGDRERTRAAFGFEPDDLVVLQPGRAIERKNVPGGVRYVAALARGWHERRVRYWLTGPAEDGYGPTLERVLERSPVPVSVGRADDPADAYAACDAVVFPSTWEGFGNPTIESVWARRPLAVHPYPVLAEIAANGFVFFPLSEPAELARFLRSPDPGLLERNLARAQVNYRLDGLPAAIDEAMWRHGWPSW